MRSPAMVESFTPPFELSIIVKYLIFLYLIVNQLGPPEIPLTKSTANTLNVSSRKLSTVLSKSKSKPRQIVTAMLL